MLCWFPRIDRHIRKENRFCGTQLADWSTSLFLSGRLSPALLVQVVETPSPAVVLRYTVPPPSIPSGFLVGVVGQRNGVAVVVAGAGVCVFWPATWKPGRIKFRRFQVARQVCLRTVFWKGNYFVRLDASAAVVPRLALFVLVPAGREEQSNAAFSLSDSGSRSLILRLFFVFVSCTLGVVSSPPVENATLGRGWWDDGGMSIIT